MADISPVDSAGGLKPIRTPIESQVVTKTVASGETVYPFQLVDLSGGEVVVSTAGAAGPVLGVCLDYGVAGDKVTVCIDPQMRYRVLADGTVASTTAGAYAPMASNGANTNVRKASGELDASAINSTAGNTLILTIVGAYESITPSGVTNNWVEVFINNLVFNKIQ